MTKQQISQELKQEFAKGNLKPSKIKKSRSLNDLPAQTTKPLKKSKSAEELEPKPAIEQLETKISVLELELEVQKRELNELESLKEENEHLREQMKVKQQELEGLRKDLEEITSELTQVKNELEVSLTARHQSLKDFGLEHSKRVQSEKELDSTVEESAEELVNQDEKITELRNQISQLKQEKASLIKDLNLTQKLAQLRKDPYFESEFNHSLTYFKYGVYALLAVWFLLMLRRKDV